MLNSSGMAGSSSRRSVWTLEPVSPAGLRVDRVGPVDRVGGGRKEFPQRIRPAKRCPCSEPPRRRGEAAGRRRRLALPARRGRADLSVHRRHRSLHDPDGGGRPRDGTERPLGGPRPTKERRRRRPLAGVGRGHRQRDGLRQRESAVPAVQLSRRRGDPDPHHDRPPDRQPRPPLCHHLGSVDRLAERLPQCRPRRGLARPAGAVSPDHRLRRDQAEIQLLPVHQQFVRHERPGHDKILELGGRHLVREGAADGRPGLLPRATSTAG